MSVRVAYIRISTRQEVWEDARDTYFEANLSQRAIGYYFGPDSKTPNAPPEGWYYDDLYDDEGTNSKAAVPPEVIAECEAPKECPQDWEPPESYPAFTFVMDPDLTLGVPNLHKVWVAEG